MLSQNPPAGATLKPGAPVAVTWPLPPVTPGTNGDGPPRSGTAVEPLALASGGGRWVLAALVVGSSITLLDSTVVGIALPSIGRDLHGDVGTLQWVVTGYALTLAAFLWPAARWATATGADGSSRSGSTVPRLLALLGLRRAPGR